MHSNLDRLAFVVAGALLGSAAHALDLADCKALDEDAKRLACYDSVTGRTVAPAERKMPEVVRDVKGDVSGIGLAGPRAPAPPDRPPPTALAQRWDLDGIPDPALFTLRPYKPVYVLPAFYSTRPNGSPSSPNPADVYTSNNRVDHVEAKFQLSLKLKLRDDLLVDHGSLWFGYTQSSRWQVYNRAQSRPFRETDYEPELIYTAPIDYALAGVKARMLGLSLTHQSNGRDLPLSRSWNRVIGMAGFEAGGWTALVRPWLRIRESADRDDNPDILDYVGRGEVVLIRKSGQQELAVTLRHSLRGGAKSRGSATVDYTFPIQGALKGYVQLFSGYGESLIDYNHRQNSIGVGLSLLEWL